MMYLAAVIVIVTLIAMASGKIPPVLALAAGLSIAGLAKVATVQELSSGLSNGGVITVAAMLVIAKGVVQTGVISRTAWWLLSSVEGPQQALRRLILPVGVASALMNTTPIVAMLIPATRDLEQKRGVPMRQVLLPIAHVTTLFGSVTLIGTSSNLVIAGIAAQSGVSMNMLSFAPVALPVALVGAVAIYLMAPLLRSKESDSTSTTALEWSVEFLVAPHAIVAGRQAEALGIASTKEFELTGIDRAEQGVALDSVIAEGDRLIFRATEEGVTSLWKNPLFGLAPQRLYAISIGSGVHGNVSDIEEHDNIRVVAARTHGHLSHASVSPGEILFVTGESVNVVESSGAVALWRDAASRSPQPEKTWTAVGILALVVVAASFGFVAVELAAVSGAVLMVLTRTLSPSSAARALDWNILGVLAGSVGLGAVVVSSGLAQEIAQGIERLSGGSVLGIVVVLVIATALMTNLITNSAAAAILTPVGIGLAAELVVDPIIVLATIGTCISFTLINPFSHQSNMMVMRPGGYTNASFARFGAPLLGIVAITAAAAAYLLLRP
ncbi:MAG: anion permease [Thermomicrobiales bacterium]|nr:anion permease [Thermomicrobiales bacterium]MCO5222775.1 SLC13 family permease [Thermomicrobiales bacterium]